MKIELDSRRGYYFYGEKIELTEDLKKLRLLSEKFSKIDIVY